MISVEGNTNCKLKNGKPEYIQGIFHDVTLRKAAEQQLIHNAYYDSLTSLPNRFMLMDQSTNGSFVKGKQVKEAILKDGDILLFAEGETGTAPAALNRADRQPEAFGDFGFRGI